MNITREEVQQVLNLLLIFEGAFPMVTTAEIALLQSKLAEPAPKPMMTDEQAAAIRTLTFLGYTYHGAEQWKPPLGKTPEPVAYLAWRDGQPCWDEDCVCQDAVYPVDSDDDRTSMPVYLHHAPKPMTDFDIRGKLSTLKCWHRLTGDEVQDLIDFHRARNERGTTT